MPQLTQHLDTTPPTRRPTTTHQPTTTTLCNGARRPTHPAAADVHNLRPAAGPHRQCVTLPREQVQSEELTSAPPAIREVDDRAARREEAHRCVEGVGPGMALLIYRTRAHLANQTPLAPQQYG